MSEKDTNIKAIKENGLESKTDGLETPRKEKSNEIGLHGPIGEAEIDDAYQIFQKYKQHKADITERITENEKWWRLRHWDIIGVAKGKENDPRPASAWLFNSIINKHADAMDNFPTPNFLPREQSDDATAKRLQKIVPCVLDANDFEQVYSDAWWYKAKVGTVAYGVFWDNEKENGLGDVSIKVVDLLNLFWQPGIRDIQDSQNVFSIDAVDKDLLVANFPFLKGEDLKGGVNGDVTRYIGDDDKYEDENNVVVYDWYYKRVNDDGKTVVHFCKFVQDHLLYASENDPDYKDTGYYEHGLYPFVFDTLFPVEDSPVGFGYIDVMKSPQMYIDKLDQMVLKNAAMVGKPRYFFSKNANVNLEQFADWSKDFVEVSGTMDEGKLQPIQVQTIPPYIINHITNKIDELKETSGNRDFSQGSTQSGVTAASAIAALQEAGSKLSRDMIKSSYRAYKGTCELVFELMRQFYTEDRYFRIDGPNGTYTFEPFNNSAIKMQETQDAMTGDIVSRLPVFDIKVQAQKQSPFSRESQNEMAKEFFQMGVFNPQAAVPAETMLEMTDFEGVEKIKELIKKNDMQAQATMQLIQIAEQMAQATDAMTGMPGMTQQVTQLASQITGQQIELPQQAVQGSKPVDSAGMPTTDNTKATQLRLKAAKQATPDK
jgi:hypothetical protein